MTKVHVMADETLGGVLREYNEVKRKANVGERIKIVDNTCVSRDVGTVWTVTDADHFWGSFHGRDGTGVTISDGEPLFHRRYVVLEPSDVIHVDGARYRMVTRRAHNGERIVVTAFHAEDHTALDDPFRIGEVFTVTGVDSDGDIWYAEERDFDNVIHHDEYLVLERIEAPTTSTTPSPSETSTDALTTSLASTAVKVASLETELGVVKRELASMREQVAALSTQVRVAREDIVLVEEGALEHITSVEKLVAALEKPSQGVAERKLTRADASEMTCANAALTRDDVVRKAIEDVKKITADIYGDGDRYAYEKYGTPGHVVPTFNVDRDKRVVVARLELRYCRGHYARGKRGVAKCASGDVFNVHIGKAIALRRALGLDVPDEYLKAPKPTDVRVGDVVTWKPYDKDAGRVLYRVDSLKTSRRNCTIIYDVMLEQRASGVGKKAFGGDFSWAQVVDDSGRCETEASV